MKKGLTLAVSGIAVCLLFANISLSQGPAPTPAADVTKVASNVSAVPTEHPLMPVIRWAEKERPTIAAIKDYTAVMRKQENVGGAVQEGQAMEVKVRHEPFSVYVKFLYPRNLIGQQAIFVRGQNDGKLVGHGVGFQRKLGTHKLDPEGLIAMRGNKYPITEMGILNLVDKLLEVGYRDSKFGECNVTYTEGTKIGPRECTMIQVEHPIPRQNFMFNIARIFVDKEFNMPIRYESYSWPRKVGETPTLIEVYTYTDLKINVGLTDADFDHMNPAYNFPK